MARGRGGTARTARTVASAAAVVTVACGPGASSTGRSGDVTTDLESVTPVARCEPPAARGAARVLRDVAYAAPGGDTLRLDLTLPAGPGPHPVVVLLHGGGWEGGSRQSMAAEMHLFATYGYAAATVSYRLTRAGTNVFPAAVQDVRCAVRWLRARAEQHALDPGRIGVLGFSAGAHLASMLGTTADVAAFDGGEPRCLTSGVSAAVQAVVPVAGPQDLRVRGPYTREQARLVTNFLGVFPGDAPDLAALASPIAHVSSGAAPFLLVHGVRDELVPVDHARRMRAALQAAGVPATTVELPGVGHSFPALDGRGAPVVGCTTLAFLDRWLRGA